MCFSDKVAVRNSIFISGGTNGSCSSKMLEVLGKYTCKIQPFAEGVFGHSMVVNNNNELMVFGGQGQSEKSKVCLVYKNNEWTHHSIMVMGRIHSCSIVMPNGIYVFGGRPCFPPMSHLSCEFLPNDQLYWSILHTQIPRPGLSMASCVAISPFEIIFTGGVAPASKRIMVFNTLTKEWNLNGEELIHGRWGHKSFLFNGKLIITAGQNETGVLSSTEILELKSWKPKESGRLHEARWGHGIGVINIKGKQKLLVFGGWSVNRKIRHTSVEAWNDDEECWEKSELCLPQGISHFAYCSKGEQRTWMD